ncbi:MAG TPA: hypothetical protein VER12_06010 [Polyangiaceae bacterium]|nr:hypothetical protein [Polyangiaceae bacterium]
MLRRIRTRFAATALLLSTTLPALANGRFPRAQRLLEHPSDPDHLVLAATYGLLVTEDRGASWSYVCEPSFTHEEAYVGDPLIDFTGNQGLLVNVQGSISVSAADACDWKQTMGNGDDFIVDHSVSKSNPAVVIAAVVRVNGGSVSNVLRISRDNGQTWSPLGSPLPLDTLYTVDIDPLDPEHLHATGMRDDTGQLVSSTDGGQTWIAHRIANTDASEIPYLAGIHPLDPQQLFIRTDSSRSSGDRIAGDALLYSSDGGLNFREVFRAPAKLLGFALAPNGSSVLVGFGNPNPSGPTSGDGIGVFKSSTENFGFEQVYAGNVNCLTWTMAGVYVCTDEARAGFELGFSQDPDFRQDGSCIRPLLHRSEVAGPLSCSPGTSGAVCNGTWTSDCQQLGACSGAGAAPRTECAPFSPPEASNGGASGASSPAAAGMSAGQADGDCHIGSQAGRSAPTAPLLLISSIVGSWVTARRGRYRARLRR